MSIWDTMAGWLGGGQAQPTLPPVTAPESLDPERPSLDPIVPNDLSTVAPNLAKAAETTKDPFADIDLSSLSMARQVGGAMQAPMPGRAAQAGPSPQGLLENYRRAQVTGIQSPMGLLSMPNALRR